MSFEAVARIADTVLLEGYVLYPYRADSAKNRYRWTFGVLAPRAWSEAGGCEPWWLRAEILVEGEARNVRGRLRFLRVVERRVEARERGAWRVVERLDVDGQAHVTWEEGEIAEIDFVVPLDGDVRAFPIHLAASEEIEKLGDVGRVVRRRHALDGRIVARSERMGSFVRVSVRVENLTRSEVGKPRADAVRAGLASTHLLFAVDGARFLSIVDPPEEALGAAAQCSNVGVHPVLAGDPRKDDVVLASPIILSDHAALAPESPLDFCDAGEIDELLAIRTRTLTPEEKALARATDPRARQIVDRAVAMDDDTLARLHGADRGRLRPGIRVRLAPDGKRRRTDAQDLLFAGRTATVEAIRHDVDGRVYLAVTLDDDPSVEMHRAKGRFHYYYPDEVEPL